MLFPKRMYNGDEVHVVKVVGYYPTLHGLMKYIYRYSKDPMDSDPGYVGLWIDYVPEDCNYYPMNYIESCTLHIAIGVPDSCVQWYLSELKKCVKEYMTKYNAPELGNPSDLFNCWSMEDVLND